MVTSCIFHGMKTTKEKQREAFRDRLVEAARSAGQYERGVKAELARYLTANGKKISEQGVKRWFDAAAIPREDTCRLLAKRLNVPYDWLRHGQGPVEVVEEEDGKTAHMYRLPVLTPDQYPDWKDRTLTTTPGEFVRIQDFLSDDAFAFTINDNSALPLAGKGMRVVVNPDDPELSDPVNAQKLIVIRDSNAFLVGRFSSTPYPIIEPVNRDFRPIQLSADYQIVGTLTKIAEHNF